MGLLDAITGWAKSAGQQAYQNVIRSGQQAYESSRQASGGRAPQFPVSTQQTRQAQQARSRASGGTTGGREVTGVKGVESGVSNPTESMYLYPIYTAAKSLAESYKKNVTDKYSGYVEPRLKGHGAWETVGQAATGLVSSPGLTVEFLGMIPAGAERLAREAVRSPRSVPQYAAAGLAMQAESLSQGFRENPARMTGELVGSSLVLHGTSKGAKTGGRYLGEGTGLVRKSTYGFAGGERIPYMSPAEEVQTILESKFISGARATPKPAGQFIPTREIKIRDPGSLGDIPAGGQVTGHGVFMTISRPGLIEPYGTYFISKPGGVLGALGGKRVYLHENVRTVQVPEPLKQSIYKSIQQRGEFWRQYDDVVKLATEQSRMYNEPIAIPSPKRAAGIMQPESEAFLVFGSKSARKITQTRFAGITGSGAIVKRIALGEQPKIKTTRIESIAENVRYNWEIGRSGLTLYNKNLLRAMTKDMERKAAELYGGALSYPGTYGGHGAGHARGVYENLIRQYERSPTLQRLSTPEDLWLRAKYHDVAKIADLETEPYRHGWAAGEAIEKKLLSEPDLATLPPETRRSIAKDIRYHTDIRPGILSGKGIATKTLYRPTATGKALATADRLALARFGTEVKQSKLFPIPEETFGFKTKQAASDIITGRRDLPIGFQVRFVEESPVSRGYQKKLGAAYPEAAKVSISTYPATYVSRLKTGYTAPTYPDAVKTAIYPAGYSGTPSYPGYSGTPSYPGYSGTPSYPGYSGTPSYPGYPGTPTTPVFAPPSPRRYKFDERKIRGIRPDLSLTGFDWTVTNPVPTWESVFGTTKAPNLTITIPEFKP